MLGDAGVGSCTICGASEAAICGQVEDSMLRNNGRAAERYLARAG